MPGRFVTTAGNVLGQHEGFAHYTVGQRKRLPGGRSLPLYVVGIRPDTREVVVGDADELLGHEVALDECNWLDTPLVAGDRCQVQLRYRAEAVPGVVRSMEGTRCVLDLEIPVRAIAPGQSGVLYSFEEQVLGGGVIA